MIYVLGGGSDLNLEVVNGTSAPASPKENTVWVNTSTAISSWDFSSEQPDSPAAGQVWIKTKDSADVVTNVLRKNGIWLGIGGTKQYVGGTWMPMDAQIYHAGAWRELVGQLVVFDNGDGDYTAGWDDPISVGDTVGISVASTSTTQQTKRISSSTGKIDLTDIDTLNINVSAVTLNGGSIRFFVNASKLSDYGYASAHPTASAYVAISTTGKKSIDVSSLSGEYYMGFSVLTGTSGSASTSASLSLIIGE